MDQEYLEPLFHSKSLHTLLFRHCSLRGMVPHTPSRIRHLELSLVEDMEPFLGHCCANLETLRVICQQALQVPGSTRLQLFPKLRNLVFTRSMSQLDTFISLAPHLEYLEFLEGDAFYVPPAILPIHVPPAIPAIHVLPAIPAGIKYFNTSQKMIERDGFGTRHFLHLHHLHVKHASDGSITPIIQRVFPNITSLELDVACRFRNSALLLARALPNVTRLKLNIWDTCPSYDCDTSQHIAETLGDRLSSLYVNVSSMICQKDCMESYAYWIFHTVFPPTVGLGGPHLQEVDLVLSSGSDSIPSVWWCWKRVEKEWLFRQYW